MRSIFQFLVHLRRIDFHLEFKLCLAYGINGCYFMAQESKDSYLFKCSASSVLQLSNHARNNWKTGFLGVRGVCIFRPMIRTKSMCHQ